MTQDTQKKGPTRTSSTTYSMDSRLYFSWVGGENVSVQVRDLPASKVQDMIDCLEALKSDVAKITK